MILPLGLTFKPRWYVLVMIQFVCTSITISDRYYSRTKNRSVKTKQKRRRPVVHVGPQNLDRRRIDHFSVCKNITT